VLRAEAAAAVALVVLTLAPPAGVTRDRTLIDPRIVESSDLVASALHPGLVWTTNDSGDSARIFGVDAHGRTVAVLHLRGARARDWEALAPGRAADGTPLLWVGDIGDNESSWPSVRVYRIAEPSRLGNQDVAWTSYDLRFPDGPRDAETLLADPTDGRLYVVSKRVEGAAVYVAPMHLRTDRVNVLTRVAPAPPLVTDGSFSPDGRTVAIRDYVWAWRASSVRGPWHRIDIPLEPQGESLTWTPDGRALLIGSEGLRSLVWRVPLVGASPSPSSSRAPSHSATPSSSPAEPSQTLSPSASASADAPGAGHGTRWRLLVAGVALGAAFSVAVAARRRR
jgi:hypothetical protein